MDTDYMPDIDRRTYLKLAGAAGVTGLAGCLRPDGDDGHHHGTHSKEPQDHVEVSMKTLDEPEDGSRYHFDPHVAWITEGGKVTWHNESGSHTATAYAEENDKPLRIPDEKYAWDSGMLTEDGATYEKTFEQEGVYDFFCEPHEAMGMLGTVLVGRPEHLDEEPGMAPPQDELPESAQEKIKELNSEVRKLLGHAEEKNGHDDGGDHHSHR